MTVVGREEVFGPHNRPIVEAAVSAQESLKVVRQKEGLAIGGDWKKDVGQ